VKIDLRGLKIVFVTSFQAKALTIDLKGLKTVFQFL